MVLELLFNGNDSRVHLDREFDLSQQFDSFLGAENTASYPPLNTQQPYNIIEPIEDVVDETPLQTQELTSAENNITQISNNPSQAYSHPDSQTGEIVLFEVSTDLVGNLGPVRLHKVRYVACSYFF